MGKNNTYYTCLGRIIKKRNISASQLSIATNSESLLVNLNLKYSLRSFETDSTVLKPTSWAKDTAPQLRYSHCFVPHKGREENFIMIIYKEFSSLLNDLGFSGKTLYSVSNHINHHYHPVRIPKSNGEFRELNVPDALLMSIQRAINNKLLCLEEVSSYAMAYRPGRSTKTNATPHVNKPIILKMDIRHFFDHLIFPLIKEKAFPDIRYSEQNRILLTFLCTYKDALPQGAPTSPAISNIIMREFDNIVGKWCEERNIDYTRYCDDMTFSGEFEPELVISLVKKELQKMGLYLNNKKSTIVGKGQKQSVTGIIVNEKISVPTEYKKRIRQEMFYCMKYGITDHLTKIKCTYTKDAYVAKLLGRINYVISIEPDNLQMRKYRKWLMTQK